MRRRATRAEAAKESIYAARLLVALADYKNREAQNFTVQVGSLIVAASGSFLGGVWMGRGGVGEVVMLFNLSRR